MVILLGMAACNNDNKLYKKALEDRDARIKELQITVIDLNNKLKNMQAVLRMKHEEVGVYRDTPIKSAEAYKKCRKRADSLQAQLADVERERTEYKLRYEALRKKTSGK